MTDERKTTDSSAGEDRLVSETYRETASERAPEHLNAAVLRNAAKAARPRYSSLRAWTRPVAWAAVVMLSVGLVLELTRSPLSPSTTEPRLDQQLSEVAGFADEAPAGMAKRERDMAEQAMDEPAMNGADFSVSDTDMLQRAEEMARMQGGESYDADHPADAAIPLSEKSALRSSAMLVEAESGCDEKARAEPQLWLACITELEAAGLADLASSERGQLAEAFPDFKQE